jgi:hypothetical protein
MLMGTSYLLVLGATGISGTLSTVKLPTIALDQYLRYRIPMLSTPSPILMTAQAQDFGRSSPTIIPFTTRMAFLLYDSKQKKIAAFPQPTGAAPYKQCDILCGVITVEDNALISARVDGPAWSKKYCLSVWPIHRVSDGLSSLGDESQLLPLSLKYHEKFVLAMTLVRQARSCAVLVVSSSGEQKVNLDPSLP